MVITTTRWSPDTCGCELEYQWETNENENTRADNFAKIVQMCNAHTGIVPPNTTNLAQLKKIYDAVLEENTRKNQALATSLETNPELADITDPATGERHDLVTVAKRMRMESDPKKAAELLGTGPVLKQNINYTWKWVEAKAQSGIPRTLEIEFETPQPSLEVVIAVRTANPNITAEEQEPAGEDATTSSILI